MILNAYALNIFNPMHTLLKIIKSFYEILNFLKLIYQIFRDFVIGFKSNVNFT